MFVRWDRARLPERFCRWIAKPLRRSWSSTLRRPTAWMPPATVTSPSSSCRRYRSLRFISAAGQRSSSSSRRPSIGFVKLPEQYSTGSSAMPQKKNPDALELIRGKCGKVYAEATALFIGVKGLPLAYNKDLQETQQPVFAAAQQVASMVRVATGFMSAVEFNFTRMNEAATQRIHERASSCGLPGRPGSGVPQGARGDRQSGAVCASNKVANLSNCRRMTMRSAAFRPTSSSTRH